MDHIKSYSMLLSKVLKINRIKSSLYNLSILIVVFVISSCNKFRKESYMNSIQAIKEGNEDMINTNVLTSESRINESSTLDNELLKAVIKGNVDKVKSLLEKGANPNIKNKNGNTALGWAIRL